MENYTAILKECIEVANDRQEKYDDPIVSMQIACNILEKAFKIKLTVEEMSLVLVALKFSRGIKSYNEDNIVDAINYLAISLDAKRKGV